ncbi:Cyclin-dependent kinase E-1, CDKE-1 [Chondrus crispus]|uniref:Cyclin-dependent kinase E-1, CDKE-1 n=1 Tax=Chondrus crispus TaxID=2769 RepID=R7QTX4_CHOCR|nr:Cyclin-dependent kinase E-1, CDKE-1 [Chondrus crispus]CDF40825.1 Cyclin-dependent kinase E-1, CDKE-1 [Chondrus crispus]|eukprot:XP_005711119.1 Cyclin-dependent kinase E-1, CDKE-1 [Chondrus crispus]
MFGPSRGRPTQQLRISEKYASVGKIGEGTYGLVYKARHVQSSPGSAVGDPSSRAESFVAVKRFKSFKSGDGISPTAIREIKLLRELKNRYIVDLVDVMLDEADKALYLVFDYAEHDLLEMIRWHHNRASQPMQMPTVKSLLWQILHGMNYLHKNWIIHRDLKPSNILVTGQDKPPNERGCVKIADFGLARLFQAPLRPLTDVDAVVVTIWYRAPELLLGAKHYTKAIDLWAIGCIFAELITSKPLFQGQEKERKGDDRNPFQADQIDKIFRILGKPTLEQWPGAADLPNWTHAQSWQAYPCVLHERIRGLPKNSAGYDLLSKLLEYDPNKRITAENALRHPFFQEEPRPQRVAFIDPNVDPYKSRPVTPLDPKKDIGWAMSATASGSNGQTPMTRSIPQSAAPSLTSAPPPSKRAKKVAS